MEPQLMSSVRTTKRTLTLTTALSRQDEAWHSAYESLLEFVQSEGHLQVPATVSSDGLPLHKWQSIQLARFHNRTLDREKAQLLEKLPGWSWSGPTAAWEKYYNVLLAFVSRHGHANVPPNHRESGFSLGVWVKGQRRLYYQGCLMRESRELLEKLPGWQWSAPRGFSKRVKQLEEREGRSGASTLATWEDYYTGLRALAQETKTSGGPGNSFRGSSDLRRWVAQQKKAYRKGALPQDKAERLEKLPGFFTEKEKERLWHETFESLWFFVKKEGHTRVPRDYEVDGVRLGTWVREQRRLYRQGDLPQPRQHKLEALNHWQWT